MGLWHWLKSVDGDVGVGPDDGAGLNRWSGLLPLLESVAAPARAALRAWPRGLLALAEIGGGFGGRLGQHPGRPRFPIIGKSLFPNFALAILMVLLGFARVHPVRNAR